MIRLDDILIFTGVIIFCVGFSALLAHSAKQRETAEAKIIYIMVDDSGKVIRQVTPEELRAGK